MVNPDDGAYVTSQMMWKLVSTAMYFYRRMLGITWKKHARNEQVWEKIGKKCSFESGRESRNFWIG